MTTVAAKVPSKQPHKAMLYYPIPIFLLDVSDEVYAIMEDDHQTTVLFGVDLQNPQTVRVCLQGRDRIISFECGEWNRMLRAKDGVVVYTKDDARFLWQRLIDAKWTVIPNDNP